MVYLRDNAGIFEFSMDGETWQEVGNGSVPSEIANPVTIGTLQLRDNAGVFEVSTDAGISWEEIGVGSGGGNPAFHNITTDTTASVDQCSDDIFFIDAGNLTLPAASTLDVGASIWGIASAGCKIFPNENDSIMLYGVGEATGSDGDGIQLSTVEGGAVRIVLVSIDEGSGTWVITAQSGTISIYTIPIG